MRALRTKVCGLVLAVASVATALPPANDDCAAAEAIGSLPFTTVLDTSSATSAFTDPVLFCNETAFGPALRTVWYRYTAGGDTVFLDVRTAGSTYDTMLAVHKGTCGGSITIDCSDDFPNAGSTSRSFVAVDPGETVLIEIAAIAPGAGMLTLDVRHATAGQPTKGDPEFVVNTFTPYVQGGYGYRRGIDVCGDGTGRFVVAWEDQTLDGSGDGIFARRFDDGGPLGGQFQVNVSAAGDQIYPSVACGGSGDFVVAWNDGGDARARRFDGTGAPVTGDVAVSGAISGAPSAASAASGDFAVVFDKGGYVLARRFDATGAPLGSEFQVSTGSGYDSHASGTAAGDVVVTWNGGYDGYSGYVVRARPIDSAGALGVDVTVATEPDLGYHGPRVATNAGGEFLVTWEVNGDGRTAARRYSASASPLGGPIVIDDTPGGFRNSLASEGTLASDGSFVVAWDESAGSYGVRARRFDATGTAIGDGEFEVESVGVYPQYGAEIAPLAGDDFVVVWSGFDGYGDGCGYGFCGAEGVRAQRFRVATAAVGAGCPPAPAGSCRASTTPATTKLQLVDAPDEIHDLVRWTWPKGEATDAADFGDPTAATSFDLCLYDASNALVYGSHVDAGGTCPTAPCWKALGTPAGSRGFKFKSKTRLPHGITKMALKPGIDGKVKIVVKGGRENLFAGPAGAPAFPLSLPVTIQLQASNGNCWEASYNAAGTILNDSGSFKGSGG